MSLNHFKHLSPEERRVRGINEHGVLMCECKRYGPPHAYEPGEWCSPVRKLPKWAGEKQERSEP